jgi:hypothetical protein
MANHRKFVMAEVWKTIGIKLLKSIRLEGYIRRKSISGCSADYELGGTIGAADCTVVW